MRRNDYAAMGGHMDRVHPLAELRGRGNLRRETRHDANPWPPNLIFDPDESAGG
jgi:hypothetical protein